MLTHKAADLGQETSLRHYAPQCHICAKLMGAHRGLVPVVMLAWDRWGGEDLTYLRASEQPLMPRSRHCPFPGWLLECQHLTCILTEQNSILYSRNYLDYTRHEDQIGETQDIMNKSTFTQGLCNCRWAYTAQTRVTPSVGFWCFLLNQDTFHVAPFPFCNIFSHF